MSIPEHDPSKRLNTRDSFMDYFGNPLNGIEGWISNFEDDGSISEVGKQNMKDIWQDFFRRVRAFMDSDFTPTADINREALQKFLAYESQDPFDPQVFGSLKKQYEEMCAGR